MAEIKWEIKKELGSIGEGKWKKEVNIISWNDKPAKIDIRSWDAEHKKMSKGITFSRDEAKKLKELFNSLDLDTLEM
ncbi:MAG TPA: hypothetical protein ENN55_04325 [Firmicutes bacterium]|nr:hypothetical protein [Bacillota bacterium]